MSVVTLDYLEFDGMVVAWVDYNGRIILTIRDYQGHVASITDDHAKALVEWINSKPIPVIDYRNDEEE